MEKGLRQKDVGTCSNRIGKLHVRVRKPPLVRIPFQAISDEPKTAISSNRAERMTLDVDFPVALVKTPLS